MFFRCITLAMMIAFMLKPRDCEDTAIVALLRRDSCGDPLSPEVLKERDLQMCPDCHLFELF